MTIPLEQQAAAVEISAANLRGHVENLQRLVGDNKRPAVEYQIAADRLPALESAARTMRALLDKEVI